MWWRALLLLPALVLVVSSSAPAEAAKKGETAMKIELRALAACQHQTEEGLVGNDPSDGLPPAIREGDRLWFRVTVTDKAHVYLVAVDEEQTFRRWWASPPQKRLFGKGKRMAFPDGLSLDATAATAYKVFVVASAAPLDWLEGLTEQKCPQWKDELSPEAPTDPCGRLYSLHGKVPPLARGVRKPTVDVILTPHGNVFAIEQKNSGEDFVAVEFQFKPGR